MAGVAACVASVFAKSHSVFAEHVRHTQRALNRNLKHHTQRTLMAHLPYVALEDSQAFHEIAETVRLAMIDKLREEGAPINVWRVGVAEGFVASKIEARTGHEQPWRDEHCFSVRTRVSVERPPFYSEG
jgi:hypothetical protein